MFGSSRSTRLELLEESWTDLRNEIEEIWKRHNDEIASPSDKERLAPNRERFEQLDAEGLSCWLTVRHDGILVGYSFILLSYHLHRSKDFCGFYDLYWLDPAYRKGWNAGVRLLKWGEFVLRKYGVHKVYIGTKVWQDHSVIFKRLGYQPVEIVFSKDL